LFSGCCDQKKNPATTETRVVKDHSTHTMTLSSRIFLKTINVNVTQRKSESIKSTILVIELVRFGIMYSNKIKILYFHINNKKFSIALNTILCHVSIVL